MKTILTICCLITALGSGCVNGSVSTRKQKSFIGAWEFIHADGTATNGIWTHENVDNDFKMTHEPTDYATYRGKTGSLSVWWDQDKQRPQMLGEYINGQEQGYRMEWRPTGQLRFAGRLIYGMFASGRWWNKDGSREDEFIATEESELKCSQFPKPTNQCPVHGSELSVVDGFRGGGECLPVSAYWSGTELYPCHIKLGQSLKRSEWCNNPFKIKYCPECEKQFKKYLETNRSCSEPSVP